MIAGKAEVCLLTSTCYAVTDVPNVHFLLIRIAHPILGENQAVSERRQSGCVFILHFCYISLFVSKYGIYKIFK